MTANNHHRLKYIIQILHCFKTYLIIKQFDFYVWIRSTGDIHLLQFASLQHGNYEKIHLLGYTNHILIILSNICNKFQQSFFIYTCQFSGGWHVSQRQTQITQVLVTSIIDGSQILPFLYRSCQVHRVQGQLKFTCNSHDIYIISIDLIFGLKDLCMFDNIF